MEHTQQRVVHANVVFGNKSENELILKAKSGDKHAFRALYDEHIGRVYALCYRLTGEKGMAEDAAQEVFIQLWRKLNNFDGQSQFSTWLHSVTANITISYMRKQKGWVQRMFNLESSGISEMTAQSSSTDIDLEALVIRFPERARMVFVLHALEGYRHEDIANMLNMAVGSSKAQFFRAKQLLKGFMGVDDE
ncbi:RNA polymerase sigma factor [Alteromonas mediterranea]|uniref:RNA polymerase sigma 70 n=1 Tax=Alteromonas mediterranea (strain DSM 17117 / CIP 110805 / LMG 28347 / Deep ecotype) TaxID=1774373 RepID=F2G9Q8_ALTMD|nr:RNA polymerase sigma factor [Alteromonas mediterranea]AGP95270.1 putative RNA polymerase sigma factor [Alteromonas mediterranea U8]AEA99908.1 RNA polymerase sigma 70 [Alteromonas mediterranea DE]AGP87334.1 putative RNA polymerase sigma factor [Alteromonas mediterranea U4]AGP91471.1 putative RNA polymerase sigma factor [Alteromonas mediterranea U7]CAH1189219.1 ECF RNA polymerase sigma factor SigW [Alteromonas mediterranea]